MSKFFKTFSSEMKAATQVIKETLSFIDKSIPDLPQEDKFDLRLIYSELLFNAVIHGNKSDVNKNVSLSVEIKDNTICSKISDNGLGFDHKKFLSDIGDDMYGESGRGILLVNSLADSLSFNSLGNEIVFQKKVAI